MRDSKKALDRTEKAFFVSKNEIELNKLDLSINRYKEVHQEAKEHETPKEILKKLKVLEAEIASELAQLEGALK